MPLYEYECDACGGRFEVIQKFSELLEECRRCGKGPVRRLLSPPAIQFKGTGWYVTDYAQKGKSGDGKSGDAAAADTRKDSSTSDSAAPASGGSGGGSAGTTPPAASTPAAKASKD
jgi:putative FmdB family regulatory protein